MKRWAGEKVKSWKLSMLPGGNCLADVVFEDGRELRYRNASIERAYSDDDRLHPTALMLHANPEQAITPTMVLLLADTGNPEVTPMASERPTCGTCPYWDSDDPMFDVEEGFEFSPQFTIQEARDRGITVLCPCRRYPPQVDSDSDRTWPITWDFDWCGSHPDFPAWLAERKEGKGA